MWSTSTSKAPLDLVSFARYLKPTVTNLGVKIDYSLKIDQQIYSVVKSSFFQLRIISKVMPLLSFNDFERVINAFVSTRLDYWNALLVGVSQTSLSRLQLVQNAAARLLTGARRQEHISLILQSPPGFLYLLGLILRSYCLLLRLLMGWPPLTCLVSCTPVFPLEHWGLLTDRSWLSRKHS